MNLAFLRKILEIEKLPPHPPEAEAIGERRGLVRLLVTPEPLPLDPVTPPLRKGGWLALLTRPEPLPEPPPAVSGTGEGMSGTGRTGLAARLFAPEPIIDLPEAPRPAGPRWLDLIFRPEPLPEDSPAPPRPHRARWLAWLFAPERIDPPDPK